IYSLFLISSFALLAFHSSPTRRSSDLLILLGATKLLIAPASSTAAVKSRSDTECSRSAGDRSEPSGPFGNPECDVCHQSNSADASSVGSVSAYVVANILL